MEFRLTYEGILLGASRNNTRAKHKHEIRKVFHRQLRRLWEQHPVFESYPKNKAAVRYFQPTDVLASGEDYEKVISEFELAGYKFFPIATQKLSLLCSVQILFLRPDTPGGVIRSGDIDNRMKTIFDALRLPANERVAARGWWKFEGGVIS
jgi:hypothetical protein